MARRSVLPGGDRRHRALTSGKGHVVSRTSSCRELDPASLRRRDRGRTRPSRRYPLSEANFVLQTLAATNALTADNVTGLAPVKTMLQTAVDRAPRDPVPLSALRAPARAAA